MKIYYHEILASAMHLSQNNLEELSCILNIPLTLFSDHTARTGTRVLTWKPKGQNQEAVAISIPLNSDFAKIKLHGSFFEHYPTFPIHEFWSFIKKKGGNVISSDISFEDDQGILDFNTIKTCCLSVNYQEFLTGQCLSKRKKKKGDKPDSNNREGVPDVHTNHSLIHLGNVSAALPGKIYVTPRNTVKVEITINDRENNETLLDLYNPDSIAGWEETAKGVLVKCVNFVSPASKRAKRLAKLDWWQRFLETDIKPIRWTDYEPEDNRLIESTFESQLYRGIANLHNISRKFKIAEDMESAINELNQKFMTAFKEFQDLDF